MLGSGICRREPRISGAFCIRPERGGKRSVEAVRAKISPALYSCAGLLCAASTVCGTAPNRAELRPAGSRRRQIGRNVGRRLWLGHQAPCAVICRSLGYG
jgi:hypothetical protein